MITRFKFYDQEIILEINLGVARLLEKQFKISLINLFVNEEDIKKVSLDLLINDEFCLDLMWFFVKDQMKVTEEEFHSKIRSLEILDDFREAFWAEVVNFSPALKKKMLLDLWATMKKELRKLDLEDMILSQLSSESLEEESLSTDSPSDKSST